MSGVAVIRSLLAANSNVIAVVPAARILGGDLPLNTAMPAISVTLISGMPHRTIGINETPQMRADRVQVTIYRKAPPADDGYPGLDSLMTLVRSACPNVRGTYLGIEVDSITPDLEGPDLPMPDLALFTRSMDFMVMNIPVPVDPAGVVLREDGGLFLREAA